MDTKYLINLFLFITYSVIHFKLISNFINEIAGGRNISVGIFFIIVGLWGVAIKAFLLKIFFFEKNPKLINCILIILGIILLIVAMIS